VPPDRQHGLGRLHLREGREEPAPQADDPTRRAGGLYDESAHERVIGSSDARLSGADKCRK
jgi:hypothetical protein